MTLGLLKACSKGLVLKVMFIQFSAGERYTQKTKSQEWREGETTRDARPSSAGHMQTALTGPEASTRVFAAGAAPDIVGSRSTTVLLRAEGMQRLRNPAAVPEERPGSAFFRIAQPAHKHTHTRTHSSVCSSDVRRLRYRRHSYSAKGGVPGDPGRAGPGRAGPGGASHWATGLPGLLSNQPEVQIIKQGWSLVAHSYPVLID